MCIEHYYTDEELKTEIEIAGVKRRLFLLNEFDVLRGKTLDGEYFYENFRGNKKRGGPTIIEGDVGNRVLKAQGNPDDVTNFALSKNVFASEMLAGNQALANVSVEAFRKIFDVLKQIASEPMVNTPPRSIRPTLSA